MNASISPDDLQKKVQDLLLRIPADAYNVWFEVGSALKHLGMPFEVFHDWSATSKKFNEEECAQKWDDLPAEPRAGWPTLRKYAAASSFVPVPEEMLSEPQTEAECADQAAHYLVGSFMPEELFELCGWKQGQGNRLVPDRQNDLKYLEDNDTVENLRDSDFLLPWVREGILGGVVVGLNPVNIPPDFKGYAPSDAMVSDNRFALLESDDMSIDEQWAMVHKMSLPIESIVHSGGKSLHIKCRINAGPNGKLYKERVGMLLDYVNRFGFRVDTNCRNASRLTRLPGALRNGKRQYLVCGACGYPDWDSFETCELSHFSATEAASMSEKKTSCGQHDRTTNAETQCSQEEKKLLDELEAEHGIPFTLTSKEQIAEMNEAFWASYVMRKHGLYKGDGVVWKYHGEAGLWRSPDTEDLNNLIAQTAHNYGAACGHGEIVSKMNEPTCKHICGFMRNSKDDLFQARQHNIIHTANGMVVITDNGDCILKPFDRAYFSRNMCNIPFEPKAQCPRFMSELLEPMLEKDDINTLQMYCGQCLLAYNLKQKLLVMSGTAGGGKGTTVNVLLSIIGEKNCAELRTSHLGNRFETASYIGKSLLVGSDVPSDFLQCKDVEIIKKLCGGDPVDAEIKGVTKRFTMKGHFNMFITSNSRLLVNMDDDLRAWQRRLLWVKFNGEQPENPISDFDAVLLAEEGPGILNWMIQGAAKVILHGFPKGSLSDQRVERLLQESNSIYGFLSTAIEKVDSGSGITSEELFSQYVNWCRNNDWEPFLGNNARKKLKTGMENLFHVIQSHDLKRGEDDCVRGYHCVAFKEGVQS